MSVQAGLIVVPLCGLPLFAPGISVAHEVVAAARHSGEDIADSDIIVLAQKIISKSEGRIVQLAGVVPGEAALRMAAETGRPAELVQLILDESSEVLRAIPAAIIVRHKTGHVLANAGIDASNVEGGDTGTVLLWPADPDASARTIRAEIKALTGANPAVVIADSLGRAWRIGTLGTAIGCAGVNALQDRRGETDLFGRTLQATIIGIADSIAGAAVLVMGEGAEGVPAAIVRGAGKWVTSEDGSGAVSGLRPIEQDMFR